MAACCPPPHELRRLRSPWRTAPPPISRPTSRTAAQPWPGHLVASYPPRSCSPFSHLTRRPDLSNLPRTDSGSLDLWRSSCGRILSGSTSICRSAGNLSYSSLTASALNLSKSSLALPLSASSHTMSNFSMIECSKVWFKHKFTPFSVINM